MRDPGHRAPRDRRSAARISLAIWCVALTVAACGPAVTITPSPEAPATAADVIPSLAPFGPITLHAVATRDGVEIVGVGGAPHSRDKRLAVVRSTDGGATWASSTAEIPALETLAWAGDRLIGGTSCVPEHSYNDTYVVHVQEPFPTACLYVSDDHGTTWSELASGRMVDPSFVDDRHGWARSPTQLAEPALYATDDGGRTWRTIPSPCPEDRPALTSVSLVAPGAGYVLCKTAKYQPSPGGGWRANPAGDEDWVIAEVQADGTVALRAGGHTDSADTLGTFVRDITMRGDGSGLVTGTSLWLTADHAQTLERQAIQSASVTGVGGHGTLLGGRAAMLVASASAGADTGIASTTDGVSWTILVQWPWSPL
jgi:hypothetical protein